MSRLQLALRVPDLDAAVGFYTTLFGAPPHKTRDGYANFALTDPPLKLVLFERGEGPAAELDHLGIEVETTEEVEAAVVRYRGAGLEVEVREQELCCHAVQDKLWVDGADGHRWEVYAVTDDAPVEMPQQMAVATVATDDAGAVATDRTEPAAACC